MLSVQVEYLKHKENERHNTMVELWNNASLNETTRHNMAQEQYNYDVLSENERHNRATEQYYSAQLEETIRHNAESENVNWYAANTGRIESQIKAETQMTNERNASTNFYNAETNRMNAKSKQVEAVSNAAKNKTSVYYEGVKIGVNLLTGVVNWLTPSKSKH